MNKKKSNLIKKSVKYLLMLFLRIVRYKRRYHDKSAIVVLQDNNKNTTFFGYHDKTPFNADESKILAMSVAADDTCPESECTPMLLGYFRKNEKGNFENEFISFSETTTWCWQQGCMLQWDPLSPNRQVVYNTLVNGNYGSEVFDIEADEVVTHYNDPVYSLDPTGQWAATLNFSRLGRLRPGYGYSLLPDETADDYAPEDDGLFVFDRKNGQKHMLVSLSDLSRDIDRKNMQHYVNHATFSPDGRRLVFFHLWAGKDPKDRSLRVCQVDPETKKWHVIESERIVSHYCWRDADSFLATTLDNDGKWHYTVYDLSKNARNDLELPLSGDGHPMFHPVNKNIFLTDSYPDQARDQHLYAVNLKTQEVKEAARLYSPFKYDGQVRCDLHPRWDRNGHFIAADTTMNGRRQLVLLQYEIR